MDVATMKKVCDILMAEGLRNKHFDYQHDIVYIPWPEKQGEVADALEELGCHYEYDFDCWAHF
jgi:hypothetical protein